MPYSLEHQNDTTWEYVLRPWTPSRQGAGLDDDVRDEVEADLRGVARIQQVDVTRCERPMTEGFKERQEVSEGACEKMVG